MKDQPVFGQLHSLGLNRISVFDIDHAKSSLNGHFEGRRRELLNQPVKARLNGGSDSAVLIQHCGDQGRVTIRWGGSAVPCPGEMAESQRDSESNDV